MTNIANKVAHKLQQQELELYELREANEELQTRLEALEKRAHAENILLRALETKDAPSKLRPHDLQDFLSKRARLEHQDDRYLEKAAMLVDMCNEKDAFEMSDVPDRQDGYGDLAGWLQQQT